MGRGRVALLAGAIALLAAALFLVVTPPGYNSDEPSHFTRLGGLVAGQLLGREVHNLDAYSYKTIAQRERVRVESGIYSVDPDYLYIVGAPCNLRQYDMPACPAPLPPPAGQTPHEQLSQHAHTAPTSYVIPAVFSAIGWSGRSTFYLARLGVAVEAASLVAVAFWAAASVVDRRRLAAVAGTYAAACSPLLASIAGSVTTSAFEIFGSFSLAVLTWALVRRRQADRAMRLCWMYAFIACALTRSAGLAFAALAICAGVLSAQGEWRELIRRLGGRVLAAVAVLSAASLAWSSLLTVTMKPKDPVWSLSALRRDWKSVYVGSRDWANKLGWNDVHMPLIVVAGFLILGVWWIAWGIRWNGVRWMGRTALLSFAYVVVALAIGRELQPTGFAMQPRFLLPGLGLLPLSAGLRIATTEGRHRFDGWMTYGIGVWALLISVAAYYVLRRNVVGEHGPLWFAGQPGYRPLGGWALALITWLLFVCVAGLATVRLAAGRRSAALAGRDPEVS